MKARIIIPSADGIFKEYSIFEGTLEGLATAVLEASQDTGLDVAVEVIEEDEAKP